MAIITGIFYLTRYEIFANNFDKFLREFFIFKIHK